MDRLREPSCLISLCHEYGLPPKVHKHPLAHPEHQGEVADTIPLPKNKNSAQCCLMTGTPRPKSCPLGASRPAEEITPQVEKAGVIVGKLGSSLWNMRGEKSSKLMELKGNDLLRVKRTSWFQGM